MKQEENPLKQQVFQTKQHSVTPSDTPVSRLVCLLHVALTYLGIPRSHQNSHRPLPPQIRHLLLPWLPCFQGNSKTEKPVCEQSDKYLQHVCVYHAYVSTHDQTDRAPHTSTHSPVSVHPWGLGFKDGRHVYRHTQTWIERFYLSLSFRKTNKKIGSDGFLCYNFVVKKQLHFILLWKHLLVVLSLNQIFYYYFKAETLAIINLSLKFACVVRGVSCRISQNT